MYRLAVLAFVAACDLQPPPPKATAGSGAVAPHAVITPPAAGSAVPVVVPTPVVAPPPTPAVTPPPVPPAVPDDAGVAAAVAPAQVSVACREVGVKVARILINNEKGLAEHAVMEQERTGLVRKTAESCTAQAWSQATIDCFAAAQTKVDINACSRALKIP